MAPPISRLSSELHLLIFANLNDLDDARDLARSCTYFYNLQRANKWLIAKKIIVSFTLFTLACFEEKKICDLSSSSFTGSKMSAKQFHEPS